jgi:hypothetical protein
MSVLLGQRATKVEPAIYAANIRMGNCWVTVYLDRPTWRVSRCNRKRRAQRCGGADLVKGAKPRQNLGPASGNGSNGSTRGIS